MSLAAGEVFAGYTVVRRLGSGGLGEVYLAKSPQLARQDVVRVLPAAMSSDEEFRAGFERDAAVAATLWHPHIVGVHGHGEYLGRLWLATDFVDGTDAARLVREHHPNGLPAEEVVEIVTAIADALDYARGRRLLHHDVTPANILLTPAPRRRILLTDFGIPHHTGEPDDRTSINLPVGVRAVDDREDQYDLAATAYHLLSGVPRFAHPLAHTRPDLATFDPALARALAKDPSARFDTCLDFAAALRDGLAGLATTMARPILRTDEPLAPATSPVAPLAPATSPVAPLAPATSPVAPLAPVTSPVAPLAPVQFDSPETGPKLPVFVPAWSEEPAPNPYLDDPYPDDPYPDPDSAHSPTMTSMPVAQAPTQAPPERHPEHPAGPTGRTWAMAGVAAVVVVVIVLAFLLARGGGEREAQPSTRPQFSNTSQTPPPPPETTASPETTAAPDTTANGRAAPPPVTGPDGVGESCLDGYQITGQDVWASHAVRGNPAATCAFVGNVLKAYWDAADPSDAPRTVVAAGAIPCSDGAECSGDQFVVTCAVEGSDPWVTCRGGRDAVVYLY